MSASLRANTISEFTLSSKEINKEMDHIRRKSRRILKCYMLMVRL